MAVRQQRMFFSMKYEAVWAPEEGRKSHSGEKGVASSWNPGGV